MYKHGDNSQLNFLFQKDDDQFSKISRLHEYYAFSAIYFFLTYS